MAKVVLTTSGVAIKYSIAEYRVRQLSDAGVLPHTRDNTNKRVFDADAVDRAMRSLRGNAMAAR